MGIFNFLKKKFKKKEILNENKDKRINLTHEVLTKGELNFQLKDGTIIKVLGQRHTLVEIEEYYEDGELFYGDREEVDCFHLTGYEEGYLFDEGDLCRLFDIDDYPDSDFTGFSTDWCGIEEEDNKETRQKKWGDYKSKFPEVSSKEQFDFFQNNINNNHNFLEKGNYVDGKKEGLWKSYHPFPILYEEGDYLGGKKEGLWKTYYENGQLKYEDIYVDGDNEGIGKNYHENGQLEQEGLWKNGEQEGLWKEYYENGQLYKEENYVDGKKVGKLKTYHENGQLREEKLMNELGGVSEIRNYHENGQLELKLGDRKINKNGTLNCYKEYYDKEGKILSKIVVENTEPKEFIYYDSNGQIKNPIQNQNGFNRIFKGGDQKFIKEIGLNSGYQEFIKKGGVFNGEMKTYDDTGILIHHIDKLFQEEKGDNVLVDGNETRWFSDGGLTFKLSYKRGLRDGFGVFYDVYSWIEKIDYCVNDIDVSWDSFENKKMMLKEILNYMNNGVNVRPINYIGLCESLGFNGDWEVGNLSKIGFNFSRTEVEGQKEIIKNLLLSLK